MFCYGGQNADGTRYYNDLILFDHTESRWNLIQPPTDSPSPPACAFAALCANMSENKLFMFGGWGNKTSHGLLWIFDISEKTWSAPHQAGSAPTMRQGHTMTHVLPDHLVLFGGRLDRNVFNDIFVFDIISNNWSQVGSSRANVVPRSEHTALLYGSVRNRKTSHQLIVFGGYGGKTSALADTLLLSIDPLQESRDYLLSRKSANKRQRSSSLESSANEEMKMENTSAIAIVGALKIFCSTLYVV